MMTALRMAREMNLPDWWIAAGFVRNKIWDVVHEKTERTALNDVDVVYFDSEIPEERFDLDLERKLAAMDGSLPWSVKNQARMHTRNGHAPYSSATDAISRWPETATCVGVRIDIDDELVLAAPLGIADLLDLNVRCNPNFNGTAEEYRARQNAKQWLVIWPKLNFVDVDPDKH